MKIYDISQEIFGCQVYPGDPSPKRERLCSIEKGDLYDLTAFSMCAHNGTHIDAPAHFLKNGKRVEQLDLEKVVGKAFVVGHDGVLTAADAEDIISRAKALDPEAAKRILIKGDAVVSLDAARAFVATGIELIGNESQTVGPEDAPMAVHVVLLEAEVILLEGIRLGGVPEGVYLLNAAPLLLGGAEGAPCRAILLDIE